MVERRDRAIDRILDNGRPKHSVAKRTVTSHNKNKFNGSRAIRMSLLGGKLPKPIQESPNSSIGSLNSYRQGYAGPHQGLADVAEEDSDPRKISTQRKASAASIVELKQRAIEREEAEECRVLRNKDFAKTLKSWIHTKLLKEKYTPDQIAIWREQAIGVNNWVTDQKVMEMAATDWEGRFSKVSKKLNEDGLLTPARRRWLFACQYCYAITQLSCNRVVYNKYLGSCYMRTYNSLHRSPFSKDIKMALLRIYRGDDARYKGEMATASLHYTMSKGDTKAMEVGDKFNVTMYCGQEYSPRVAGKIDEINYDTRELWVDMNGMARVRYQMPIVSDPNRPDSDVQGAWMFHGSPPETGDGVYVIKAVGADNVLTFYEHLQGNLKECCGLKCPKLPPCRDLRLVSKELRLETGKCGTPDLELVDYGYFTHERDENDENPKITGCYRIRWTRHIESGGPHKMLSLQIFKTCSSGHP